MFQCCVDLDAAKPVTGSHCSFLSTKAFLKETRLCFGISWKMDFCNPALIETKSAVKKQGVKSDFEQRFKGRLCRREGGINKHLIVG